MIAFLLVLVAVASAEKYNCGKSVTWQGAGHQDRHIIGGTDAPRNAYPWQISLERCSIFGCDHSCGAVLISSEYVVTAAHCVSSAYMDDYSLVLGQHIRGEIDYDDKRRIEPISIKQHPKWNSDGSKGFPNDVAVMRLSTPAPIDGKTVVPAKLPSRHPMDYTNSECWISGWGLTRGGSGSLPMTLQHAKISVIEKNACRALMGDIIEDYHICVYDVEAKRRGSCNGDSGGPLQCKVGDTWEVAGVTSFGYVNCPTSYSSVYARLSYFRDWIRQESGVFQEDICQ